VQDDMGTMVNRASDNWKHYRHRGHGRADWPERRPASGGGRGRGGRTVRPLSRTLCGRSSPSRRRGIWRDRIGEVVGRCHNRGGPWSEGGKAHKPITRTRSHACLKPHKVFPVNRPRSGGGGKATSGRSSKTLVRGVPQGFVPAPPDNRAAAQDALKLGS